MVHVLGPQSLINRNNSESENIKAAECWLLSTGLITESSLPWELFIEWCMLTLHF